MVEQEDLMETTYPDIIPTIVFIERQ